ncbi:ABC-type antimicrobial peptide transport system, permease component [Mucilaginibacter pineti]|uniref:ABC-type antimicrobial peptide transport system, permease component n=1 Tax=Mucilaginibacter pineti TaxID=1391627 RepID=A0A1G6SXA5_9SPHI|nr:ABC transporter permease [Mucilaginibacter pineti]SDD21393.1 ABC-type antimicrobial peptide transport system, permease component [Mucilaginibacter pineti]
MLKNYFKIAFRNFGRHKLFTFINVIGLSIGISAALVIYIMVDFDFNFDKFHKEPENVYRIVTEYSFQGEASYNSGVTGPLAAATQSEVTGVKVVAPFYTIDGVNVFIPKNSGTPARFKNQSNLVLADGRYFDIFNYQWLAGSAKTALKEPYQVVLTSDQAKVYFPAMPYSQMLGKTVIYDSIKTTVTGIVQNFTKSSDLTFHDFISYSTGVNNATLKDWLGLTQWGSTTSASQLFVKLNGKASAANVEKQLNLMFERHNPKKPEDKGNASSFHLQPLNDLHFNQHYSNFDNGRTANKTTMYGLLIIALFLLLLGCINFVNLTTAQASQRSKEIGVRKTMGSTRAQLIIQFLSETFLITLFAVIVAVALAPLILKLFADFVPHGIKIDYLHHISLLVFLVLLTVVVSLLSGFYPALVLSGYKPALVLKNQAQTGSSKTRNALLRKSLTVTQFVIAQFFIMATILVSKQIYYALHKDLGFKKDAIIVLGTPFNSINTNLKQVFMNKISSIPQIDLISVGGASPSSGNTNSTTISYKDGKKEIKTDVQQKFGDENYTKLYQIKLLAGRYLTKSDSSKSYLINATYAKVLGFKNPATAVGHLLDYGDKKITVVGVVADFYQKSLHDAIKPLVIMIPENKYNNRTFHIALKPQTQGGNDWKKAIASIQKTWKELYPDDDFEYNFYDENIAKFYNAEQHTSTLLTWATGLSIFISCLGLLGLAMYTTNLRTKEIGVRKVLGASVAQIVRLLSTELVLLIVLAFVIVTPIAWYAMNKWMENFADRTTISWWIFALSGTGMLLAALCTLSFQTVKAAVANPVKSLRSE